MNRSWLGIPVWLGVLSLATVAYSQQSNVTTQPSSQVAPVAAPKAIVGAPPPLDPAYEKLLEAKRREAMEKWSRDAPSPSRPVDNSSDQAGFAKRLEVALLSNGRSADVFIEKGPQLTIFMSLSKAFVYQMIVEGHVLANAYERRFKVVRFMGKGGESWYFDLSKGVPSCDTIRKLCI